jgi:SAM-dependent methyltransferase
MGWSANGPEVQVSTRDSAYTEWLRRPDSARWKRWLDVQRPYRWNLRRLKPGLVLDVGCGVGRSLGHLDGHGVGIDHNPHSVAQARARGFEAYTSEEFAATPWNRGGTFDSLLCSHVLEHLALDDARGLLAQYLPLVKARGRVIVIVPQEAGYRSDPTHVTYIDRRTLAGLARVLPLDLVGLRSFPFPPVAGRVFRHNETVALYRLR